MTKSCIPIKSGLVGLAACLLFGNVLANPYPAVGNCAGLPRVPVTTPANTCLHIVQANLKFPRGIVEEPGGSVLVAEMGGWAKGKGRVSRLTLAKAGGQWVRETLFDQLDRPHQIRIGPDQKIYVGVIGGIFRFDPKQNPPRQEWVIGGGSGVVGPTGTGLHPLTNFVFDVKGNLVVNNGSGTNQCEPPDGKPGGKPGVKPDAKPDATRACPEAQENPPRAALLRYAMQWPQGQASAPTVLAAGLRNSMALAVHPSGTLLQGDNSRDAIHRADPKLDDAKLPHDELNVIIERDRVQTRHFGWPYCYDMNATSPEYAGSSIAACKDKAAPIKLLAPHAAPLGMLYLTGKHASESLIGGGSSGNQEWLIVPYHGYRKGAQRIVAWQVDANGLPQGNPVNLIHGWEADQKSGRPLGAPVEVAISQAGSLWITEDRNGTVLRLVREPGGSQGKLQGK